MKLLLLLTCLLASTVSYCQLSIKAGPNMSYFSDGDQQKSGIDKAIVGFTGGFSDNIKLGRKTYLDVSLLYASGGAKNPDINKNFYTYSIVLPVAIVYKVGAFSFKGGGYVSRMLYARDWNFDGYMYGWWTCSWSYMKRYDYGVSAGLNIDFVTCSLDLNYNRGLVDVRGPEKGTKYNGCRTSSLSAMLEIPFSTFSKN